MLHKLAADKRLPVDAYDQGDTQKLASGYLLTADNQIDTTTGTDKLKAVFDNKDQALFPNQFVNIHLVMEDRPNALVVPSAAIQTGNCRDRMCGSSIPTRQEERRPRGFSR